MNTLFAVISLVVILYGAVAMRRAKSTKQLHVAGYSTIGIIVAVGFFMMLSLWMNIL